MKRATPDLLKRTQVMVEPALIEAVGRLSASLAVPVRYHFGWVDPAGTPLPNPRHGKGIRPTLALLSAELVGAAAEVALPGALAVEIVHNFSLVHDDIIDNDPERRHRATVWKAFGAGDAIIAGDAMMLLGLQLLLDRPTAPRVAAAADLAEATASMIAGQHMDMSLDSTEAVDVDLCWEMVSLKTGALLAHASAVGAILAGAPERTVRRLRSFGLELGRGFQAIDDLLGIWGDPSVTGKPAGNDLRERKKSIPVAVALASRTKAGERLAGLYAREHLDDDLITAAAALVEEAGGRDATVSAARDCMRRAVDALRGADIDAEVAGELEDLAAFVVERDF